MLNLIATDNIVFPTRVGMNRENVMVHPMIDGVPHTRGDEPQKFLPFWILT